jgi:hypothetical protein
MFSPIVEREGRIEQYKVWLGAPAAEVMPSPHSSDSV